MLSAVVLLVAAFCPPQASGAGARALLASSEEGAPARPLADTPRARFLPPSPAPRAGARNSASLFAGRTDGGFFAAPRYAGRRWQGDAQQVAARLRDLIARAEAGPAGYDAVQHGADIPPPARPTQMTLAGIDAWIRETPGQPHAIGRYQFIPPTLRRLIRQAGLPQTARFSPQVQDQLADALLEEAGLTQFRAGEISRQAFMHGLARIWAGLPLPGGRSYYHGYAGNKATMAWEEFDTVMARIFPG
ncbi:MAG: hypothetical protein ACLFRU_11310 [Paracoccaceae bacterium]